MTFDWWETMSEKDINHRTPDEKDTINALFEDISSFPRLNNMLKEAVMRDPVFMTACMRVYADWVCEEEELSKPIDVIRPNHKN